MIAAIDCGTNTIKLLIGEPPEVAVRTSRMVRLGQGVDRTGVLAEEALARAFAAIDEYAALIDEHRVDRIRFCATSATRDATNAAEFAAGVHHRLGVWPEVLSGAEEAALSFAGATRGLRHPAEPPVLVVDIGGGSTELVLGDQTGGLAGSVSLDMGSVRMHERYLHSDPPTGAEIDACIADIEAHLDSSPVDPAAAATLVGVAGTIITVASGVLDLAAYDPDRTDQSRLPVPAVHRYVEWLLSRSLEQRRALPYLHPGRADVIGAGALILGRVLRRTRVDELTVSESDILDGIAWSMVQQG